MDTRLTRLLGIEHPVVLPGMTYVSTPELVAAVSLSGGLGILASGGLSPQDCRAGIEQVRALTPHPFAVGCSLLLPGAAACAKVALDMQVPVINISMGKGDWVVRGAHAYGGKVIATVSNEKHARSAIDMGVDGLIVTGHEAAAHGGLATTMVLVPAVRNLCDLPIIAAGGIADGRGLVAALALGADAAAMGTRFAASLESPVHAASKQRMVTNDTEATIYSSNFDTFGCRVMDTPGGRRYTARRLSPPVALSRAVRAALEMKQPLSGLVKDALSNGWVQAVKVAYFGAATLAMRKAMHEGNLDEGVQLIGQSQGLVHAVLPVDVIMARVMMEAHAVVQTLSAVSNEAALHKGVVRMECPST